MADWIDFSRWPDCSALARPGHVFEVENAQGQVLITACEGRLDVPWDWRSGPVRFRPVPAPPPTLSNPIPSPATPPGRR